MKAELQTRVVVYVEVILFVLGVLGAVVVICLPSVYIDSILMEVEPEDPEKRAHLKSELGILIAIVCAAVVIVLLVWLIIVILLYVGAKDHSIGRLMLWLVINCIVCALQIFVVLATLVLNPKLITVHIPSFIFLGYRVYSLYVVRTFMIEIRYAAPSPMGGGPLAHHQQHVLQPQYAQVQYSSPYYEDTSTVPCTSATMNPRQYAQTMNYPH